jgi:outer membrane protein assembly factor BamE (lipoprotein component of BamABCDE complex)
MMNFGIIRVLSILAFALLVANAASASQEQAKATAAPTEKKQSATASAPTFTDYRGVRIGMSATDVRSKLGKPKIKDKSQDLFVFDENESAQIFYDDQEKVYAISIDYSGKSSDAPSAREVLGKEVTARADGSIYERKPYPDAGYWLSYNRTSGDQPQVTITMQKIPN